MNRREFLYLGILTGIGLSGCASSNLSEVTGGLIGNGEIIKMSSLPQKNITLDGDEYIIKNGYLVNQFSNQKIFDEDGDIIFVHKIKNKWFYIVKVPNKKIYKLKLLNNKETIRIFNVNKLLVLLNKDNIFLLSILGEYDVIDNVYKFNGDSIELINKNLDLYGSLTNGIYLTESDKAIDIYGNFYGKKTFNATLTSICGGAYNNLIAINNTAVFNGDTIISAYNKQENKTYVLFSLEEIRKTYNIKFPKLQFLKSGHKVVLKLFLKENPKLIYLNELYEVKSIDKTFKPIKIIQFHKYENKIYQEYTIALLSLYLSEISKRGIYSPLF